MLYTWLQGECRRNRRAPQAVAALKTPEDVMKRRSAAREVRRGDRRISREDAADAKVAGR